MKHFAYKPGPTTLNGPIVDAFAVRCEVLGVEVLVAAADPDVAEAIHQLLQGGVTPQLTHVLIGQPPWYQNDTQRNTLDDWSALADRSEDEALPENPHKVVEVLRRQRSNIVPPSPRQRGLF